MKKLVVIARPIFLLSLTLLQLYFFGMPALQKYLESGVAEEKVVEKTRSLRPPAVTLCPFKYNYRGWRIATETDRAGTDPIYQTYCKAANTTQEFEECVENETFSLDEAVLCSSKGKVCLDPNLPGKNLTRSKYWSWDLTVSLDGRCFTLDFDQKVGMDLTVDALMIHLNKSLTYYLFLHPPDLNLITYNVLTMPVYQTILDFNQTGDKYCMFMMKLIRHERINRPTSACDPDPGYNFNRCVKERLSEEAGCKLPWDKLTKGLSLSCYHCNKDS